MAIPAEGPSFFTAPEGKCKWISMGSGCFSGSCARSFVMYRSYAWLLTQLSASSPLSLSTSPRLPVSLSFPPPGTTVVSIGRSPPSPMPVTTSPYTIPRRSSRCSSSSSHLAMPKIFSSSCSSTTFLYIRPFAFAFSASLCCTSIEGSWVTSWMPALSAYSAHSTALYRTTAPMARSSDRTPASRV